MNANYHEMQTQGCVVTGLGLGLEGIRSGCLCPVMAAAFADGARAGRSCPSAYRYY